MASTTTPTARHSDDVKVDLNEHERAPGEKEGLETPKDVPLSDLAKADFFRQFNSATAEWHQDAHKRLLRKVDLRLLPMLVLMYLTNFLDRAALARKCRRPLVWLTRQIYGP